MGNDRLPRAFADSLKEKILYGSPVTRIEHDKSGIRVVCRNRTEHHTFAGDFLIIAIPFSVLRRIELSPRFSAEKQKAIDQLPYYSVVRVSLQSRKKFWNKQGLTGEPTETWQLAMYWTSLWGSQVAWNFAELPRWTAGSPNVCYERAGSNQFCSRRDRESASWNAREF